MNNMSISDKLNEILIFCANKKIDFNLTKEGSNNKIEYTEESTNKKLNIIIGDLEDKNLFNLLDDKLKELKNLFK
jgi:hypothetical protein